MGLDWRCATRHDAIDRGPRAGRMFAWIGGKVEPWIERSPWTNVYGLGRTLLAMGTAGTLLTTDTSVLFHPGSALLEQPPFCSAVAFPTLFCVAGPDRLEPARLAALAILMVVASGWRPRFTGPLHWWVSYSLQASALVVDGGDQITSNLTLLLLPLTSTDPRRWHWAAAPVARNDGTRVLAWSSVWMVRLQVAVVYWHAAVAKTQVPEWVDGTATYYWFTDPHFGAPWPLDLLVRPAVTSALGVVVLTWGGIILETALFMALTMPRGAWPALLVAGIAFHVAIALIHGLPSFSVAMTAALILYLRPPDSPFQWRTRHESFMDCRRRDDGVAGGAVRTGGGTVAEHA